MSNGRRVRRSLVVLGTVACVLALAGPTAASTGARPVNVWFVRAGEPQPVRRTAATVPALVRALLAGPTLREQARGFASAIPAGTPVRTVTLRKRIVTLDLGGRFATGVDRVSLRDRVTQVVRTMRGVPGVVAVRLRIEGGIPVGLFPGYDLRRPVTEPVPTATRSVLSTRDLQQLLADLGFMDPSGVSGSVDTQTQTAVLGFQKWAGLPRDGLLTTATVGALERARRPEPARRGPGARIEVQLGRQVALLIRNGRVERVVHISSGAGGATPIGSFHVFRKERYSWSVPFKVWLPWASYFVGGVAFHEFGSVPTYAASHGCVRVNHYDAQLLYEFAGFGTPVDVFWETQA